MPLKPKYIKNEKVNVKGVAGTQIVHASIIVPVPQVIKRQFVLVDTVMYKFASGKDWFYAYETEVKK